MNLTAQHRRPRKRSALATYGEITFVASRQLHCNNVQERPSGYCRYNDLEPDMLINVTCSSVQKSDHQRTACLVDESDPDLRHGVGLGLGDTTQGAIKVGCDGIEAGTPINYY